MNITLSFFSSKMFNTRIVMIMFIAEEINDHITSTDNVGN
jgi:hypothetical protein